jgi:hypothetical protein
MTAAWSWLSVGGEASWSLGLPSRSAAARPRGCLARPAGCRAARAPAAVNRSAVCWQAASGANASAGPCACAAGGAAPCAPHPTCSRGRAPGRRQLLGQQLQLGAAHSTLVLPSLLVLLAAAQPGRAQAPWEGAGRAAGRPEARQLQAPEPRPGELAAGGGPACGGRGPGCRSCCLGGSSGAGCPDARQPQHGRGARGGRGSGGGWASSCSGGVCSGLLAEERGEPQGWLGRGPCACLGGRLACRGEGAGRAGG